MMQNKKVLFKDLGLIDYTKAWQIQKELFNATIQTKLANNKPANNNSISQTSNYLLFCEHPHVYTLGKHGNQSNLLAGISELQSKKADFVKIDRGGDITYHGPGQIVGYPVIDLENFQLSIRQYVYLLEEAVILTISDFGLTGKRLDGASGVWLDPLLPGGSRKICAIGIRVSRWVTMHGFAFNVNTNLDYYNYINPCGFTDKTVTSLSAEVKINIDVEEVKKTLINNISNLFGMEIELQNNSNISKTLF